MSPAVGRKLRDLPPSSMPATVLLLVLVSALLHASWNAVLKRTPDPEDAIVGMMAACALLGDVVAVALGASFPASDVALCCAVSGAFEAGYYVTLARALARAPLGSVYTVVRGGALVLVWPISILAFGESISWVRLAGTVLVVLGLAATGASDRARLPPSLSPSPSVPSTTPPAGSPGASGNLPRFVSRGPAPKAGRSGLAVAALCAVFVGGYHLAYKVALLRGGRADAVAGVSLTIASLLNIVMVGTDRRRRALASMRAIPVRTLVGGALGSIGFIVFLAAMKSAGAGVVLTLRNTSILFAQVFGLLLGERARPLGLVGAGLVTIGAILLAM